MVVSFFSKYLLRYIFFKQVTHLTKTTFWDKRATSMDTSDSFNFRDRTSERLVIGSERTGHPGKLYDSEDLMTTGLIITEPITWSRLKVVYSFEYDGTLR